MHRIACLAAALLLVADALFVMAHRVFSLGATLPFAFGCVLLLLAWRWDAVHAWLGANPVGRRAWRLAWVAFWLWIATVAAFWLQLASASAAPAADAQRPAVIVVLGSGTPGGKPSPMLAARLDVAYERAQAHPDALVLVSGGVDFGESRSEGEVMGDYLRAKGLAAQRIAQEERSTSTEQNLLFSRAILRQRGLPVERTRVEIVTSDFHTLRARWIARRAGYTNVVTVGAPTPVVLRYNAWLREYFAVISGFVLREF